MRNVIYALLPLGVVLLGCPTTDQIDHMEHQPKGKPYRTSEFFADGHLMRHPPVDTIALEHDENNGQGGVGLDGGIAPSTESIPFAVTAEVMNLGKAKFEIMCSVCHGRLGDGNSIVARKMSLRPPPNLTTDVYKARSDANLFMIITNGYGYMNPYRDQLSTHERWAVVAYLRALQLSQNAGANQLTADDLKAVNAPPPAATPTETTSPEGHHE